MTLIRVDASTPRVEFPGWEAVMAGRSNDSFASDGLSRVELHPGGNSEVLLLNDADAPRVSSAITRQVRR